MLIILQQILQLLVTRVLALDEFDVSFHGSISCDGVRTVIIYLEVHARLFVRLQEILVFGHLTYFFVQLLRGKYEID